MGGSTQAHPHMSLLANQYRFGMHKLHKFSWSRHLNEELTVENVENMK